jgi:hypothetical protein
MWPLEKTYPGNSGLGAEILGFTKGGNSGLGAEIPAPRKFQNGISGPLLKVAPQLEIRDLVKNHGGWKFWNFRPPEILRFQNFRPLICTLHHGL